jgi:hypothetical protein
MTRAKFVARLAILAIPLALGGCDTIHAIRAMDLSDLIVLPWETAPAKKPEAVALRGPDLRLRVASETVVRPVVAIDGLQPDDLRAPFGLADIAPVTPRGSL